MPARTVSGWTEARVHKSLIVRSRFTSKELLESVRKTISELTPDSAVFGVTTVQQTVSDSARLWSFLSQLLGVFASLALLLAAIGIYGVMSYSVSERSHEIGLCMALGPQPGPALGLVLQSTKNLACGSIVHAGPLAAQIPLDGIGTQLRHGLAGAAC